MSFPTARETVSRPAAWRLRRLGFVLGGSAIFALVAFHALLLVERLRDLSILEPTVALQWVGTVLLLGALAWLKQRGVALTRGRSALAFWLLVLLLHLVPAAPALAGESSHLLLAVPASGVLTSVVWALLVAGLLLVLSQPSRALPLAARLRPRRAASPFATGFGTRLFARPPPGCSI